ncbi:MAG TPA: metallophosphoesterase [Candidatus Thermoplasmatota archaeon]|nr:metallophosphoesterase [Candidatus Thermoplasmatota archaeon]
MRIAASADVHARAGDEARIAAMFASAKEDADVLVLGGDLTDHGRSEEMEALVRGLHEVGLPVVAVLGNHDHESGGEKVLFRILASSGIHVLDRRRPTVTIDGIGFAGVKGFGGGFGARLVRAFGEEIQKAFVAASVVEAEALRAGLMSLDTPRKVAVLHYAPVAATVEGEPTEIWPFLGTSRLEQALDEGGAHLAVHGHAHHGSPHGKTTRGVPVHNVSIPVLRATGSQKAYVVMDV